jgi:hypothetical protein
MKRKKIYSKLKPQTFDEAIAKHIGDLILMGYNDFEFFPESLPQRNPKQVPYKVWQQLVFQYLCGLNTN